jgi:hypothetical protein
VEKAKAAYTNRPTRFQEHKEARAPNPTPIYRAYSQQDSMDYEVAFTGGTDQPEEDSEGFSIATSKKRKIQVLKRKAGRPVGISKHDPSNGSITGFCVPNARFGSTSQLIESPSMTARTTTVSSPPSSSPSTIEVIPSTQLVHTPNL